MASSIFYFYMTNLLRNQFPMLNNPNLKYLDSAATSQKPQVVIDSIVSFYTHYYASSHGVHSLAQNITNSVENSRNMVANFVGGDSDEIIFVSGATDGINLIANGFLEGTLQKHSDVFDLMVDEIGEVLICVAEHHSNILPWQRLCNFVGLKLVYFGVLPSGNIDMQDLESKINIHTKLVICSAVSNTLGVINDVKAICGLAHRFRALVVVDTTQAVAHFDIKIKDWDCDFLIFSGHKIYAPTGIGILYAKSNLLARMPSYRLGGEMVESVSITQNIYKNNPYRFEAGTSNFAGIIGLQTALEWFVSNKKIIFEHEKILQKQLLKQLLSIPKIQIYGYDYDLSVEQNCDRRIGLVSFNIENINALDLAILLDLKGVCVRAGQHCTGILHENLNIVSSCRISLGCYNTIEEIDFTINSILQIIPKLIPKPTINEKIRQN